MSQSLKDFHCHITDDRGAVIYSNLSRDCLACAVRCTSQSEVTDSCGVSGKRRRGSLAGPDGHVFLCTNDKDLLNSQRVFRRELSNYSVLCQRIASIREEISQQETSKARRLIHNLITLNAHSLQNLYSVIPQDDLATFSRSNFRSQRDLIRSKLIQEPDVAAQLFILTLKNQGAVKNELSVFKRLYDSRTKINRNSHSIHKVMLNVANYFFQDFTDKNIIVTMEDSAEKVSIDYESVQVALYHLFDNAAKYCAQNSQLNIEFARGGAVVCVLFHMRSYFVREEERNRVYDDDFSGAIPRETRTAGQGLGMGLIRELLRQNDAELDVQWGRALGNADPTNIEVYAYNTVIVRFRI
jgi:K+-sensing histidine kinase KdpD